MSAQALTVYESLRASGIDEARARRAAEAIDERIRDQVAAAEEKTAAKFVAKDEYSSRMENTPARDEVDGKFDQILAEMRDLRTEIRDLRTEMRKEIHFANRISLGLLIVLTVLTVKIVIGL